MDHVVHINNGSGAAKPIVLRLLPGEETIFDLKVVNHGRPSDISLEASDPVFKAVRFRKQDSYVDKEETIPVMARMPANKNRLDGEILLTSNAGESRVPISLLRDSEDSDPVDADQEGDEYQRVDVSDGDEDDADDNGADDSDADSEDDEVDGPFRRVKRIGEDSEDDEEAEDGDDFDAIERMRKTDDEEEKEPRRIVFSRDRDLQRYRSAGRQKADDDPDDGSAVRGRRRTRRSIDEDDEGNIDKLPDSQANPRFNNRIDDRFVDRSSGQETASGPNSWEVRQEDEGSTDRQRLPHELPRNYQDSQPEPYREDGEGNGSREGRDVRDVREIRSPSESDQGTTVEDDGYLDQDGQDFDQGNLGPFGLTQIIPMVIFLALLAVLVLTFITYTIPEFPGALGSSVLIVTLIIYGAATLLKA